MLLTLLRYENTGCFCKLFHNSTISYEFDHIQTYKGRVHIEKYTHIKMKII